MDQEIQAKTVPLHVTQDSHQPRGNAATIQAIENVKYSSRRRRHGFLKNDC